MSDSRVVRQRQVESDDDSIASTQQEAAGALSPRIEERSSTYDSSEDLTRQLSGDDQSYEGGAGGVSIFDAWTTAKEDFEKNKGNVGIQVRE